MKIENPNDYTPQNTIWAIIAFEGPDRYSLAGGLGVRVSELSESLAALGYETHLIFAGNPTMAAASIDLENRHLWRVAQEVSKRYPKGVYEGEEEKLISFEQETPSIVLNLARRAQEQNKRLVLLGEDWQTAATMIAVHERLYWQGLLDNVVLLWNANSTFGFNRIDWPRLDEHVTITGVSRYMKQKLLSHGIESLVIPNGIPDRHLERIDREAVKAMRDHTEGRILLTKFARFDPDKNWLPAVQAVARLKAMGERPLFFVRGGIESYGVVVINEMKTLGLRVVDLTMSSPTAEEFFAAVEKLKEEADIVLLRFFVPEAIQRILYSASDAVLANSVHEPFGLVGLEVMAARGVAFVGSTGEDYAMHLLNSVSLDTTDPNEIVANLIYLHHNPTMVHDLRRLGHITARLYVWPRVVKDIINKLSYVEMTVPRQAPHH
ncbi:MAG: glycosyltransferase family 4 protein [Anaerolineales bacterium]|nr:glycosyltransferase family 4 protein [Anaerolineales bacterium]